jgi:predicted restriction endonuclease
MTRNFNDPLYKQWRKNVYSRDKHCCQWPGCNSRKKLNAHHIKTWADFPSLRFSLDNGITLCYLHHKLIRGIESYYEAVFLSIARQNGKINDK